jgi:hypothetical protein
MADSDLSEMRAGRVDGPRKFRFAKKIKNRGAEFDQLQEGQRFLI